MRRSSLGAAFAAAILFCGAACQPAAPPAASPSPAPRIASPAAIEDPNPLRATAIAAGTPLGTPAGAGGAPAPRPIAASPSPQAAPAATATPPRRVRPATPTVAPPPIGDRSFKTPDLLVDPDRLQRSLSNPKVRVIDARPAESYAAGHVPGAISLSPQWLVDLSGQTTPGLLSPAGFKAEVQSDGISNDSEVVVYDDDGGLWAARVIWALNAYGLSRTSLLEGGFRGWQAAGKPIETAPVKPPEGKFEPKADGRVWLESGEVSRLLRDPKVVIVDARSEEEYRGRLRLAARAGRLPGAVLHYWRNNLRADGQYFKSAAELETAYRAIGVTPDKTVIVYCQNGVRAAHVYLALKLIGYPDVRVYDAGWGEWGNLRLPIDTEGS